MRDIEITVSVSELLSKLEALANDEHEVVTINISGEDYDTELRLSAYDLEEEQMVNYGSVPVRDSNS